MPHAALLVIDVQRGAFDGQRCPRIARGDELVAGVQAALAAARAAQLAVVFVQHSHPGGVFDEATPRFELHEALAPQPGELRLTKRQSSSFEGTPLADELARFAAREVLLCGLQSDACVYNTAIGALARGLATTVLSDAHSTWPTPTETAAAISERINTELRQRGATLCTTKDLRAHLAQIPSLLEREAR